MIGEWELEEDYTIDAEPIVQAPIQQTQPADNNGWEIESDYMPVTPKAEETPIMDFLTKPNDAPKAKAVQESRAKLDMPKDVSSEPVALEESTFFLQDKKFETDNIRAYTADQLKQGKSKIDIYNDMKAKGATTLDIQEASQVMRGISTGAEVLAENVTEPIERGKEQVRVGVQQAIKDVFDVTGITKVFNATMDAVGIEPLPVQERLDTRRADIKAGEDKYTDKYGEGGVGPMLQGATKYAPEVAMAFVNPTSPIKTALMEGILQYTISRGEGFDKTQSAVQGGAVATIAGGLTKLANSFDPKLAEEFTKAIDSIGEEKAANLLEVIEWAKSKGVDLLSSDVAPGTQLSQLVDAAKSNPLLSSKLKDITEEEVETITKYMSTLDRQFTQHPSTDEAIGDVVNKSINDQEAKFDTAISNAYDDLGVIADSTNADISNRSFINWLESKKNDFTTGSRSKDIDSSDRPDMIKVLDGYINDLKLTGNNVNVQDLYKMIQSSIRKTSEYARKGEGSSERANQMITELFEGQFDVLGKKAGTDNVGIQNTIKKAKDLYKERVGIFGYRKTGKGSEGSEIVNKFRDAYAKEPTTAFKLINSPQKLKDLKVVLGEDNEVIGMMKQNFLRNAIDLDSPTTDLSKASKEILKNKGFTKELFGEQGYKDIKNLGEVLKILGKREKDLSKTSSLVGNSLMNSSVKGVGDLVSNVMKMIKGKYLGGTTLAKMDKSHMSTVIKGLEDKIDGSLEDFLNSKTLNQLSSEGLGKSARSVDDLYQSPEGLPTRQEADEVQAGLNERQATENLADASTKAEQETLRGIDKQLQRQQTNLNKEISAGFRTRTLGPDDRLEYNRIQEEIIASRNSGDRESVQQGMDKLSTFREHVKSLPKQENSTEEANRIAIEQATAARQRRQVAAQKKLARQQREAREAEELAAQQAAEAEASEANRLELRRQARINRRAREQEAEAERARLEAQRNIPTTAEQRQNTAYGNLVDNLNKNLGEGWTVDGGAHPNFRNRDTGEYFSLHIYGDRIGATTTGLQNGSGAGSKVYHGIFDLAEELGGVYKPSSTLLTANPVRTGMNMITYSAKRGEDTPWIEIGEAQKGIGRRGTDGYLGGKRLTRENANKLAKNLRAMVTRLTPKSLTRQTTDEGLQRIAETTGTNSRVRLGYNSLKTLRDFMRRGAAPGAMAGMLGVLMMDDDIMNGLEQAAQGEV